MQCLKCAKGYYESGSECIKCPNGCSSWVKDGSKPLICNSCKDKRKTGSYCTISLEEVCPGNFPSCAHENRFATSSKNCDMCTKWNSGRALNKILDNSLNTIGTCWIILSESNTIPNCEQHYDTGNGIKCSKCSDEFILNDNGNSCHTVFKCKRNYLYFDSNQANCRVAAEGHIIVSSISILPVPEERKTKNCTGYLSLNADSFDLGKVRCSGCAPGYVLDTSYRERYDCVKCSISELPYCSLATAINGKCVCAACLPDFGLYLYRHHPSEPGCIRIFLILRCTDYTLSYINGDFQGVCRVCVNSYYPSLNGLSYVLCSNKCPPGSITTTEKGKFCECSCKNGGYLNPSKDRCRSCSIDNCKAYEVGKGDICKCTKCRESFKLNRDQSSCLDCNEGSSRDMLNCKDYILNEFKTGIEKCIKCTKGYTLKSNPTSPFTSCLKCFVGCKNCEIDEKTNELKCIECHEGWVLNNKMACLQCPQIPESAQSVELILTIKQIHCVYHTAVQKALVR